MNRNSLQMSRFCSPMRLVAGLAVLLATGWAAACSAAEPATPLPAAAMDSPATTATSETVVLAGGCFWGVQGVFQHTKGVTEAVSGYSGGYPSYPSYRDVSSGTTGHAESVRVTFNPQQITLGQILQIYFSVAHNPTELNRQGPDRGTQYRSEVFYTSDTQKEVTTAYIAQLNKAAVFPKPIVTKVESLAKFYPAEDYHQNYATLHPDNNYIAYNDLPKIANLKVIFPELYREQPVLVTIN